VQGGVPGDRGPGARVHNYTKSAAPMTPPGNQQNQGQGKNITWREANQATRKETKRSNSIEKPRKGPMKGESTPKECRTDKVDGPEGILLKTGGAHRPWNTESRKTHRKADRGGVNQWGTPIQTRGSEKNLAWRRDR